MQINKLPSSSSSTTSLQITEIHSTTNYDLKDQYYPSYLYNQSRQYKRSASTEADSINSSTTGEHKRPRLSKHSIWKLPNMIETFEAFQPSFQTEFILDLIKKSSKGTLQLMSSFITPAMKRDFLSHLPLEISRRIIRHLDAFSLSQASCVCKNWKVIIDGDKRAWIRLLLQDGYSLIDPITKTRQECYKTLYARHHTLKQNWKKGRAEERDFKGHDKFVVTCLQFDDEKIVSGADDSHVNIYDTATGKKKMTLEGHEGGVWALQYVGQTLVTGSTDRRVRVWNMETGQCTHIFTGHTSTIRCLLITKPTQDMPSMIVTGSRDSTLRVWRLPNTQDPQYHGEGPNPYFLHSLTGHRHSVRAIASHKNIVVSGSYDNTVRVWDIKRGRLVHLMEGHTQKVYSVVIDAGRNRCMSGSMDSSVRIWDLNTGECLKRLEGHTVLVGLLGLTGQHLVSAAADSILRVWSPETGVCQHALSGHDNSITCFQHDDQKVISGSEGGLKMWDIKTGKFIRDLITDVDGVWRVAFDDRRCITAIQQKNETSFRILDFGVYNL
ncbi:hypothetical protein G6F57_001514 [Rhizopus arrhizus]|uniref:F-box domain-containing protein n=1 Tax=Rhizopus oryzae TaxID=64495 RepID=A0A9P6X3H5_RHIOR|nr:hypothetical protein G6F23_005587 [Rhizopus arrhizus]KAG0757299.1 hypothetical protein G6F24_010575 [Rhizopus arrhizus]KAG0796541.1 hypothetical protein G6F21_001228 [Rhizopus arrhizus]KAG0796601.1 hypothetical protein G6F22_004873 [Rhizopus arrhizus]KAG0814139.1 hypothetical protein G6F20_005017 [Rhizopus arrhizus]